MEGSEGQMLYVDTYLLHPALGRVCRVAFPASAVGILLPAL